MGIYYKAICKEHNFEGGYYTERKKAVRSGKAHKRNGINHNVKILTVFIPDDGYEVQSEVSI